MLQPDTRQNIQEVIQSAFGTLIEFNTVYSDTQRKAGYEVPGDGAPRDTIDEGDLLASLEIREDRKSVQLVFDDGENPTMYERPELEEEILNNLDIPEIVVDMVRSYFGGII